MSSKDKEKKSMQDTLKNFFKISKGNVNVRSRGEFVLTEEIRKELSRESPLHVRTRTMKSLNDIVLKNQLEDVR